MLCRLSRRSACIDAISYQLQSTHLSWMNERLSVMMRRAGLAAPGEEPLAEPLAFLPQELPDSVDSFFLEEGAISKTGETNAK